MSLRDIIEPSKVHMDRGKNEQKPHGHMMDEAEDGRRNHPQDPPSHERLDKSRVTLGIEGKPGYDLHQIEKKGAQVGENSRSGMPSRKRRALAHEEVELDRPNIRMKMVLGRDLVSHKDVFAEEKK